MRIGVNCFSLHPFIGGMNQYFLNLFNGLLDQDTENEYFFFYSEQNINELRKLKKERWEKNGLLLKNQEEVANHRRGIDLYFCPLSVLWPRPLPLPMVVTLPDIQEVFYPEFFTEGELYSREYHYRGSIQTADRVITISNFSKETIVKQHRISPKKVIVAYPCIDPIFFKAKRPLGKHNTTFPFGEFILYPANPWFHKNHDGLLKAIKYLKEKRNLAINVILTGHEIHQGYPLINKVKEYGLSEQVWVGGYLSKEELAGLYAGAKMVVFPSLFEGFGIPLLEAMAAECPVAASRTTSLPEIGGEAVEYFDPCKPEEIGQAIEYLWNNPDKRKELVQKGLKRVKQFTASDLIQSHLEAFAEAARSFSLQRYYWQRYWVHPIHRLRVNRKYRNLLAGNKPN